MLNTSSGQSIKICIYCHLRNTGKMAFTKHNCVLFVLEILCSSTKLTFVLMLSTWCVFHVLGCALSVYHLRSHIWILDLCVFALSLCCYGAHGELKMVANQYTVNTKICWTHASTNLLGLLKVVEITFEFQWCFVLFIYGFYETELDSGQPVSTPLTSRQGAVSIRKTVLPGMAIPMLKIRRPNGRLIFNMEIAIRR